MHNCNFFYVLFVIMFLFMYNSNRSTKLPDSEWPKTGRKKRLTALWTDRRALARKTRILNADFTSLPRGATARRRSNFKLRFAQFGGFYTSYLKTFWKIAHKLPERGRN